MSYVSHSVAAEVAENAITSIEDELLTYGLRLPSSLALTIQDALFWHLLNSEPNNPKDQE